MKSTVDKGRCASPMVNPSTIAQKQNRRKRAMATTNAKQKIKDALVELLNEKDFEKISILDIVR